jgi:hypothetical protein
MYQNSYQFLITIINLRLVPRILRGCLNLIIVFCSTTFWSLDLEIYQVFPFKKWLNPAPISMELMYKTFSKLNLDSLLEFPVFLILIFLNFQSG